MPIAGKDHASRARAHLGHARRYSELGEKEKANAHLKRGLHYAKLAKFSFGTGSEGPGGSSGGSSSISSSTGGGSGTAPTTSAKTINIDQVRESLRGVVGDKIGKVDGLGSLIETADLDMLCSLLVTKLSPGYDAAALMAAALVWRKEWQRTTLNDHKDVKSTIEGVIGGTEVFTGAHFGQMKELFVFTDVSLQSKSGNAKGDIDDKFALCLLAHAARESQLQRIVVVISARQKAEDDITKPRDVVDLFTTKLGDNVTTTLGGIDESLVWANYKFTNKKPPRYDLDLVVCFDRGIEHLNPGYAAVKTFDAIIAPTSKPAVAVVIGPISVHTADILEAGSMDGKYALVAGVSVTGGVNGGASKMNDRFAKLDGANEKWNQACTGGTKLKNMFELTTSDTRRLLMTLPFLANHNIASIQEVKEAHTSVWRNHLGFYKEAKPGMAFRILASNSQTTYVHGTDAAAALMNLVFEEARATNIQLPNDTEFFAYTNMSGLTNENPRYLEIAKRYAAWCFANLYLHLVPAEESYKPTVVQSMKSNSYQDLAALDIRTMAVRMADTKDEKKETIIRQVIKDVGGGTPSEKGGAADLWGVYVTSIVATYMRLLSTEILLNKVGLFNKIAWTGTTELDTTSNGLYKLKPYGERKNIVSVE